MTTDRETPSRVLKCRPYPAIVGDGLLRGGPACHRCCMSSMQLMVAIDINHFRC